MNRRVSPRPGHQRARPASAADSSARTTVVPTATTRPPRRARARDRLRRSPRSPTPARRAWYARRDPPCAPAGRSRRRRAASRRRGRTPRSGSAFAQGCIEMQARGRGRDRAGARARRCSGSARDRSRRPRGGCRAAAARCPSARRIQRRPGQRDAPQVPLALQHVDRTAGGGDLQARRGWACSPRAAPGPRRRRARARAGSRPGRRRACGRAGVPAPRACRSAPAGHRGAASAAARAPCGRRARPRPLEHQQAARRALGERMLGDQFRGAVRRRSPGGARAHVTRARFSRASSSAEITACGLRRGCRLAGVRHAAHLVARGRCGDRRLQIERLVLTDDAQRHLFARTGRN